MENKKTTKSALINHYHTYPHLQIQDIFKYIYQSSFGCEHMVSVSDAVENYIQSEYDKISLKDARHLIDALDGDYSRIHLNCINKGLSVKTLAKMFANSSTKEEYGPQNLKLKLESVKELAKENKINFSLCELDNEIEKWKLNGFAPVHHSETFREYYKPSYRVIANRYASFLELFIEIDKLINKGSAIIAIEGTSASGKSTLADTLSVIYDCTVFHMDDFFLKPEQRTNERFSQPGGNIDYERFLKEVVIPLKNNQDVGYRKFDCSTMTILPEVKITPKRLTIIEGAYSMHPEFGDYFDLSVFLDISADLQKERINKRNPGSMAQMFFDKWIPLEKAYFTAFNIKNRCDMTFNITNDR